MNKLPNPSEVLSALFLMLVCLWAGAEVGSRTGYEKALIECGVKK